MHPAALTVELIVAVPAVEIIPSEIGRNQFIASRQVGILAVWITVPKNCVLFALTEDVVAAAAAPNDIFALAAF